MLRTWPAYLDMIRGRYFFKKINQIFQSLRFQRNIVLPMGTFSYRCNICGNSCQTKITEISREIASCPFCNSSLRMRSVIHLLSIELFGESLPLTSFPVRPDITGIGLSDWEGYAVPLSQKLNYKNTYYHTEPKLDITDITPSLEGTLDFLISSDVFEHIPPPVSIAFHNAYKLLKPGGVLIFTVPYAKYGKTVEHFPELCNYKIIERKGKQILRNITKEGTKQIYENLNFHGGAGNTLEMRLFAEPSLMEDLEKAGFHYVTLHGEPYFEYGIYWDIACVPLTARKEPPFRSVMKTFRLPTRTNNITFNIDRQTDRIKTIELMGWAYINGENTHDMEIFIVLQSARFQCVYSTVKIKRPDVTAHFKSLNLDDSGFHALISKDEIEKGEYEIGILIKKHEIMVLQYSDIEISV